MTAQAQTYRLRDHHLGVVGVENATSRRSRADITPFGGSDVSSIWLEVEELPAAIMANWSWESANASSSQQASPIQSSPLPSSSSHSSHEAMQRTAPVEAPANPSRSSLEETLQTCLTSLPPSTSALQSPAPEPSRVSSSRALGPTKPSKRRSRATKRVPTTVLEANTIEFKDMVQRLTGIPASTSPAPVRPQPHRAPFIRPDRPLPTTSMLPPPPASSFNDILRRNSAKQFSPHRSLNVKPELEAGSSSTPFSMSESIMTTRALSAPVGSWWDAAAHYLPNVSSSSLANEIIGMMSGPRNESSSAELPEDNEVSMSQFDAWLADHEN